MLMRNLSRRVVLWRWLLPALLLPLCGCPYNSAVPLPAEHYAPIDRALLGMWQDTMDEDRDHMLITFYEWDARTYGIVGLGLKDDVLVFDPRDPAFALLRGQIVMVGTTRLLQIQSPTEDKATWTFDHYMFFRMEQLDPDTLSLAWLEDTLLPDETQARPKTSQALYAFIAEHVNDPALFDESPVVFGRVVPPAGAES